MRHRALYNNGLIDNAPAKGWRNGCVPKGNTAPLDPRKIELTKFCKCACPTSVRRQRHLVTVEHLR